MIPLFRKIRKQYADDNKPVKYIRYAIGEIVLVVIGILIALQVNNLNEQHKNKQLDLDAMIEIRVDLINSMSDIHQNLFFMRDYLKSAWKIKKLISTSDIFPDSLGSDLLKMTRDEYLYPSSRMYSTIKSAGFKVLTNDKIRLELDDLYEFTFPRLQSVTSIEPSIKEYFFDYVRNNFRAVSTDTLYNSEKKVEDLSLEELFHVGWAYESKYIPIDYNHFRNDPEFTILLDNSIRWRMMKIWRYMECMDQTMETIDLIEENLKGKVKLSQIREFYHRLEKENEVDKIIDIIKKGDTDDQPYDISARNINGLGWTLFNVLNRKDQALKIFKLNTEIYPDSDNVYYNYGDCLLEVGDTVNAIKAFHKSLELNPKNADAKKMIANLK
jgi:tetratricopeptide (TPR) repeat protein